MGFPTLGNLNIWMVHFIETIKMVKMKLDWASILSKNLGEKLVAVKNNKRFYMTSYLVYLLAARATYYPGLYKMGSM